MYLVYPLPLPLPSPPPPKKKNYMTIALDFSNDDCFTQEKLETMVMQNLGGGGGDKGACENGFFVSSITTQQFNNHTSRSMITR